MKTLWRLLLASYLSIFFLVGPLPFQIVGAKSPVCTEDETHSFMQDLACAMLTSKSGKVTWPMKTYITIEAWVKNKGAGAPAYGEPVYFRIDQFTDKNGKPVYGYSKYQEIIKNTDKSGTASMTYIINFSEGDQLWLKTGVVDTTADKYIWEDTYILPDVVRVEGVNKGSYYQRTYIYYFEVPR